MRHFAPLLILLVCLLGISVAQNPADILFTDDGSTLRLTYNGKVINTSPSLPLGTPLKIQWKHDRMYGFMFADTTSHLRLRVAGRDPYEVTRAPTSQERLAYITRFLRFDGPVNGSSVDFQDESFPQTIQTPVVPDNVPFTLGFSTSNLSSLEVYAGDDLLVMLRPDWHHENIVKLSGTVYGKEALGPEIRTIINKILQNTLLTGACLSLVWILLNILAQVVQLTQNILPKIGGSGNMGQLRSIARDLPMRSTMIGTAVIILITANMFVLLYTVSSVLEYIPHTQDEIVYLFQSKLLAHGLHLYIPSLPEGIRHFFDHEFIINNGKWFGMYTNGIPTLLALGQLLHAPFLVNPIVSCLTLTVLVLTMRKMHVGHWTIVMACTVLVISPMQILLSSSFMSHTLAGLATLVIFSGGLQKKPVLAGIGGGVLLVTRPYNAVIMGAWYLVWVAGDALISIRRDKSHAYGHVVMALMKRYLIPLIPAVPFVIFQLWNNLQVTGSVMTLPISVYSAHNTIGFGLRGTEWGSLFTFARGLELSLQNYLSLLDMFAPVPFFVSLVPVIIGLISKRRRLVIATVSIFLIQVFAYIPFHGNGISYGPRYWSEVVFALAILFALGLEVLYERWHIRLGIIVHPAIIMVVILLYAVPRLQSVLIRFTGYNAMTPPTQVLSRLQGRRSLVLVESGDVWQQYGKYFAYVDPFFESDVIFARSHGIHNVASRRGKSLTNQTLVRYFPGREVWEIDREGVLRLISNYAK